MFGSRFVKILASLLFCAFILAVLYGVAPLPSGEYPEVESIGVDAADFKVVSARFESLAKEKGALYAYEVLRRVDVAPGTDLHLLAHEVGDELYKQKGVGGIADCTQEFRNACSHTIVIGALNEFGGEKALGLIRDSCKAAPGGSGAYTMCYHGLGHGVLAFFGYDLEKTVALCNKTGTAEYENREYTECVGGAMMELMGGGGHDHDLWLVSRAKYLPAEDPLAPCSTDAIPGDAKALCYLYLTPHLFESNGGNLAAPVEADFKTAFLQCDRISKDTPLLRDACFAGIGKEFPVLAMARDIRLIEKASDGQLKQMHAWCVLAPHEEAFRSCEHSVLESLFWGGENDPVLAVRYCGLIKEGGNAGCYRRLIDMGAHYLRQGDPSRTRLCAVLPREFAEECRMKLP